jgi:hypothetical protein
MSNAIPYLVQGKNVILVIDGESHTISKDTHISYARVIECLKKQDWGGLRECVVPSKAIVNFGKGYVGIDGSTITWKGKPFHNALATRMIEMYQDGFPIDPMVRFMEKLMENPSKRSVDQVYGFLEKNKLPITETGNFLAFKRVRADFMDVHSNTIDNSIGQVVEMDRNLVDDNPDSHCSSGLHFCSESYLGHFGNRNDPIMILEISPADVVSIPTDYNGAKGRCCKYTVVGQVAGDPSNAFGSVVNKDFTPKPIAKTPTETPPLAAWPFAVKLSPTQYTVKRKFTGQIEATGATLTEARAMVQKNVRQKKAQLIIQDSSGNIV